MTHGPLDGERPQPEDTVEIAGVSRFAATTAPRPGSTAWTALAASTIGSVHVRDHRPLQDAVLTWTEGDRAVVAVADGHGHRTHFRSDTGSALAVVSAVEELRRALGSLLDAHDPAAQATALASTIVATWRTKVDQHHAAQPFEAHEQEIVGDDPHLAYGTTLLVTATVGDRMIFWQIGDGDAVLVTADGQVRRPLPPDPDLDGVHTHSLCQPDPVHALRLTVIDTLADDVALAFLCTDGFGNSRVDADWWHQTGDQLLEFVRSRGVDWVREQLGSWVAEPAQIGGDDTTLGLLVRTAITG